MIKHPLRSAFKTAAAKLRQAVSILWNDLAARAAVGSLVSAGLGRAGLHLSADQVMAMMIVGAALAGMGPHNPGDGR
jgi:hypothetical protein